jgi:5-methylcytosine-specific restriction endonuclease McrA
MDNHTTKTCTKCGQIFPATLEYFYREKLGVYGLKTACKVCVKSQSTEYAKKHPETTAKRKQTWAENNRERVKENRRKFRLSNPESIKASRRKYALNNRDRINELRRIREQKYPEKYKLNAYIQDARRRARWKNLPNTFSASDWLHCLEYFNYCCAVCGCQLRDLLGNKKPHADHWIPLSSPECAGTVPTNIVCLCNDCNRNKWAKLPLDWLTEKYGVRKAKQVLERIEAYFRSLDRG